MIILNIIRGMFMAFADSVPGVSGGTIAFIMGFYNELVESIGLLVSKSTEKDKKRAFVFLLKLGLGWLMGMITSILFISSIFERQIYNISSLFVGFILFSIPLVLKEEKHHLKNNFRHLIYVFIGIVVVSLITYFNPVSKGGGINISIHQFSPLLGLYVFVAGSIAISAMILPGISGSTLLLIFGLYTSIINAAKNVILLNFNYLPILILFGAGVLFGIVSIIRVLEHWLKTKRSQLVYLIIGLMLGSLYAVFMGPTTLDVPRAPLSIENFSFVFFLIGGATIFALDSLKLILK